MLKKTSYFIVTGFLSGTPPKAPGTFGTIAFIALWLLAQHFHPLNNSDLLILSIGLSILGLLSTAYALKNYPAFLDDKDPKSIVIDEWAGMSFALIGTGASNTCGVIVCFMLFRFFDILKPYPISAVEKLPGAYGIMADDILAGVISLALMTLYYSWGGI